MRSRSRYHADAEFRWLSGRSGSKQSRSFARQRVFLVSGLGAARPDRASLGRSRARANHACASEPQIKRWRHRAATELSPMFLPMMTTVCDVVGLTHADPLFCSMKPRLTLAFPILKDHIAQRVGGGPSVECRPDMLSCPCVRQFLWTRFSSFTSILVILIWSSGENMLRATPISVHRAALRLSS